MAQREHAGICSQHNRLNSALDSQIGGTCPVRRLCHGWDVVQTGIWETMPWRRSLAQIYQFRTFQEYVPINGQKRFPNIGYKILGVL